MNNTNVVNAIIINTPYPVLANTSTWDPYWSTDSIILVNDFAVGSSSVVLIFQIDFSAYSATHIFLSGPGTVLLTHSSHVPSSFITDVAPHFGSLHCLESFWALCHAGHLSHLPSIVVRSLCAHNGGAHAVLSWVGLVYASHSEHSPFVLNLKRSGQVYLIQPVWSALGISKYRHVSQAPAALIISLPRQVGFSHWNWLVIVVVCGGHGSQDPSSKTFCPLLHDVGSHWSPFKLLLWY